MDDKDKILEAYHMLNNAGIILDEEYDWILCDLANFLRFRFQVPEDELNRRE